MKKIISLVLALAMVFCMIPFAAYAAEPAQSDGIYQISTAEELVWVAEQVNSGAQRDIKAVLTADIDLSEVTNWPGIGKNQSRFAGSFDGQGHTVTFKEAMWGLFGYVEGRSGAIVTIKNVKTLGSIKRSGIAHDASFAHFEDCINGATIIPSKGESYVGGILGSAIGVKQGDGTYASDVKILRCGNEASVTAAQYVGGILGYTWVNTKVEQCYNTGNINGTQDVGGLVGYLQSSFQGSVYVADSYNTGRVTGTDRIGGIAGSMYNGSLVRNCYNSGSTDYAITGYLYNSTAKITNSYFLGTASAKSSPDYTATQLHSDVTNEAATRAVAVSGNEMASAQFAALLGDVFKQSCPSPVLSWQTAVEHTGAVCTNCSLGSTEKESYDVTFQQHDGYTLSGEPKAIQDGTYRFTIAISEGYEKASGFAVKVNGEAVTPDSSGTYSVVGVNGPLSVTVLNVKVIPGNHQISLPGAGNGYVAYGEKTVKRDEDYTFTIEFKPGFSAGSDLTVIAQEILPQSELDKGTKPYEQTLQAGKDGSYTISKVQYDYRILISGVKVTSTVAPVTISFTVTKGYNEFEVSPKDIIMMDQQLTVPYFDLSLYDLEKYYYNPHCYVNESGQINSRQQKGNPESAYNNITAMHAFIVATELYYLGYNQSQVGTGASYRKDPEAFKKAISWSQDAGSSFMDFWDHGTNLNYYINYAYPLAYDGWGSTSDQVTLKNGDILSVHEITGQGSGSNFGFFTVNDTNSKFNYGKDITDRVTLDKGQKVKLTYFWTVTSGSYNTSYALQKNAQLYWIHDDDFDTSTPDVTRWNRTTDAETGDFVYNPLGRNGILRTDSNGEIIIDTAGLEPGLYHIGAKGGFTAGGGTDDAGFVSAGNEAGPAFFQLEVLPYEGTLGDVNGDTKIDGGDASEILMYYAKITDEINPSVADVNGDGKVDGGDASEILMYYARLIDKFSSEK